MLKEYIEERECRRLNEEFRENLESYRNRSQEQSDKQWLQELILRRCRHISRQQAEKEAEEIIKSLEVCEENLASIEDEGRKGISKEKWLENRLQEAAIGMSAAQYSRFLQQADAILYEQNKEMAEALSRSSDGHIMMNPNLDGNIAEHMLGRTVELQGYLQGKDITVDVRGANTANSVDVRVKDVNKGVETVHNYQMKFGKDAKATIRLIEDGNYNNQRIVVPSEQLKEVQEYFSAKGSQKTISDHIEINGISGKSFTKEEMKELQRKAQDEGVMPTLDDYYYSTKEYALSVGKNAGVTALQMAAVTTGIDVVSKICKGEEIKPDELVENALKSGADAGVKAVASGTLYTAAKNGIIPSLKKFSAGKITNIAFVGVENAKVLFKMAEGKLSTVKAMDQMGKNTVSMIGGMGCMALAKGVAAGFSLGGPVGAGISLVAGMVGYAAGSSVGDKVYSAVKSVAKTAKEVGKKVWNTIESVAKPFKRGLRGLSKIFA